ncbi:MBL fold metallo-hydrolase [Abyssicoccus albus]|uniref:MBL fold metallo-hydrolase n=1 Tax=Abyssicoccus albus TaxID=1817405 RepID=UPI00097E3630|nr:MBL fold metallo-hydrolase [Abyssicoccus albus]AQL56089.1 hypothetical protein BVH56_03730 [Abyssicoccus albus]
MIIKYKALGPVETNCYVIKNPENNDALIIDPSANAESIIQLVDELDAKPVAVLLTHAHFDHIAALEDIMKHYQIDVYSHPIEHSWLKDSSKNGSNKYISFGLPEISFQSVKPIELTGGTHNIKGFNIDVRHTPGHSPGSLTFVFEQFAVVGDTLFKEGIGRTDLYQGEENTLIKSIHEQLLTLDEDMLIYPGHGANTTVGQEMDNNPFLSGY